METEYFVSKESIVREIWGSSDTILFIFAGASAEFALNKAVDWLYFTGKLPKDPLARLFSTVAYAREIVFAEKNSALKAIDRINSIHASVEKSRGKNIPDWAYRDVLFMLIDYSIRSFELLERPLKYAEKEEVYDVFLRVGKGMNLKELPSSFKTYESARQNHLEQHLHHGDFTKDLYRQYRKSLGVSRYLLLLQTQKLITPPAVSRLLSLRKISLIKPLLFIYKHSRNIHLAQFLKDSILPSAYIREIRSLNHISA